ncbi:MAG TPA: glycosyltransferase family 9 protein [Thermodesulfovibrionales bacterium]|nr:glycosyltransferase family 9 protein [Thermodesulfovibrionales bacterium]
MSRLSHNLLDRYIERYVREHPHQLKKIAELAFTPRRFLVISSTALGDTLLSTPAVKSLRKSFPKARITALLHKNIASLFMHFKYIDKIIPYHGGYKRFFETARKIGEEKPEVCLIFHGNGPQDIAFSVLSGAQFILKHPTKSPYRKYLAYDFEQTHRHTIEERLDLVRKIGGTVIDPVMEIPPLIDRRKREKIARLVGDGGILIGFQIGAADRYKMWSPEKFIGLARLIARRHPGVKILLTGVAGERVLARKIVAACGGIAVSNICGKLAVDELPYLLERLNLLVTNDTGPMHLAFALGTPTVALFSPTDFMTIGPYHAKGPYKVVYKPPPCDKCTTKKCKKPICMEQISEEEVLEEVEQFM